MNDSINSESERKLFDRILKYTGVFGSVQGVAMAITLILTKVKSVLLGPAGYGITESLNRTADVVKNVTNLGIQTVAVPGISLSDGSSDRQELYGKILVTRSWALLTAIAGMAVTIMLAPLLGRWAFAGDRGYTLDFILLSAAVAAAAVTGGEIAVLRGTKLLRKIALSQLLASILSLCISVPLYWFFRLDGIIPALVLTALGTMLVTCCYSFRSFPYRSRPFSDKVLREGLGMIGFGLFFTVTAFLGAWAWSFIARFLTGKGGPELTGTYSAGYMLVTYFTTLLLSVTDSEYFPRLSAAGNDKDLLKRTANNQSHAMLMLSAPLVICFIIVMPLVVYVVMEYEKFHSSIALAQLAVAGVFFKSASQPVAYVILAKSDRVTYLIQETICYILLIACILTGYNLLGIKGIGLSLAVWELLYLGIVLVVVKIRYDLGLTRDVVISFLIQAILVSIVSALSQSGRNTALVISFVLLAVSAVYSYMFFRKHTSFLSGFGARIRRLFRQ